MPIISALEIQRTDPGRVNVYLDGAFAFGASSEIILGHSLTLGRELSDEEVAGLRQADAEERAYAAALNFLSFRPRSRREIEDYLRRKKIDGDMAATVLERLERLRLVDDQAFAQFWVENRQTFRPRGTRALRLELRQKGLGSEVIDQALEDLGDEEGLAYQAGLRKARAFSALDEREFFRKMVPFLQRRGFSYEVAAAATRRIYRERHEPLTT